MCLILTKRIGVTLLVYSLKKSNFNLHGHPSNPHYQKTFSLLGFINLPLNGIDRGQCFLCGSYIASNGLLKPTRLKSHLLLKHPESSEKDKKYFEDKLADFKARIMTKTKKELVIKTNIKK